MHNSSASIVPRIGLPFNKNPEFIKAATKHPAVFQRQTMKARALHDSLHFAENTARRARQYSKLH